MGSATSSSTTSSRFGLGLGALHCNPAHNAIDAISHLHFGQAAILRQLVHTMQADSAASRSSVLSHKHRMSFVRSLPAIVVDILRSQPCSHKAKRFDAQPVHSQLLDLVSQNAAETPFAAAKSQTTH